MDLPSLGLDETEGRNAAPPVRDHPGDHERTLKPTAHEPATRHEPTGTLSLRGRVVLVDPHGADQAPQPLAGCKKLWTGSPREKCLARTSNARTTEVYRERFLIM